jgi:hypothetical protein
MFLYASKHCYDQDVSVLVKKPAPAIQSIPTMCKRVPFRQRWFGFGLIFSSSS